VLRRAPAHSAMRCDHHDAVAVGQVTQITALADESSLRLAVIIDGGYFLAVRAIVPPSPGPTEFR
jgi:hypothetical protein